MLVVSVSPWLTWFHTVFLTQLIPHNTAHCPPQLPASPCQTEEKFSATERHNWNRKRILFWGLWSIALRLWRTLRSRVKPVLSCPCVRTSFPTALEGEMRNYLHALLRIKREGKWQWRHADFMSSMWSWCSIFQFDVVEYCRESILIEGMFHYFINCESHCKGFLLSSSTLPQQLFYFP